MWTWRSPCNPYFEVTSEVSWAILHGIEGLDPHKPVFQSEPCYLWRLWHSVVVKDTPPGTDPPTMHIYLKTPWTGARSLRSQNLRMLLYYHHGGPIQRPQTSSRKPCPCGSLKRYGECCFPTVLTTCHQPLCVNPYHLVMGPAPGETFRPPVMLPACPACTQCSWTPNHFLVSEGIRGYHDTATLQPSPLTSAQLYTWRHESLQNEVQNLEACEDNESCTRVRQYLKRRHGETS